MTTKEQSIVSVSMTTADKKKLDEVVDRIGIKQKVAIGRLLTWFARQSRAMQVAIAGGMDEEESYAFMQFLVERSKEGTQKVWHAAWDPKVSPNEASANANKIIEENAARPTMADITDFRKAQDEVLEEDRKVRNRPKKRRQRKAE